MARFKVSGLFLQAVSCLAVLGMTAGAHAGWWHGGSSGGSSGGWGSSGGYGGSSGGGSSGGYARSWGSSGGSSGGAAWGSSGGSRGGGLFSRWHHHHQRGHGSSGGWGSSGGSSGGYGSGGSSGGMMYYAPMQSGKPAVEAPMDPSAAPPAPPAPGDAPPPAETETPTSRLNGLLSVEVSGDARIYVNGQETSSTGENRQYISRNLQPGYNYTYEVRAEIVRDGKTIEEVKTIDVRAGEVARVAFKLAPASKVETSLTVRVPAQAKVYLAGNKTSATGEVRVFRTTSLSQGSRWNDYLIKVELEQEGRTITREETITLAAGEQKELTFDFDAEKVADAR